jgi:hypothetical protein
MHGHPNIKLIFITGLALLFKRHGVRCIGFIYMLMYIYGMCACVMNTPDSEIESRVRDTNIL